MVICCSDNPVLLRSSSYPKVKVIQCLERIAERDRSWGGARKSNDWAHVTVVGRSFRVRGAVTGKAWLLTDDSLTEWQFDRRHQQMVVVGGAECSLARKVSNRWEARGNAVLGWIEICKSTQPAWTRYAAERATSNVAMLLFRMLQSLRQCSYDRQGHCSSAAMDAPILTNMYCEHFSNCRHLAFLQIMRCWMLPLGYLCQVQTHWFRCFVVKNCVYLVLSAFTSASCHFDNIKVAILFFARFVCANWH